MICIYNSITNPENGSLLHKDLLNSFATQEEADYYFSLTQTQEFKERFGDWITQYDKEEKDNYNIYPLTGEPRLQQDRLGQYYFRAKDGSKMRLDRKVLDFDHVVRKSLVDRTLFQLFGDNIQSNFDILDDVNINSIFTDTSEGSIYDILNGNIADLRDVKKLVTQRLRQMAIKVANDKEEQFNPEDDLEFDEVEFERNLDLRQSFEKNSKDNASANIKFMFSFIPEMEIVDGKFKQKQRKVTLSDGTEFVYNAYYPFDEIWNKFETTLANTVDLYNGGQVVSLFNRMIDKMYQEHSDNDSIKFLLSELKQLPEIKQTEFVQAFNKNKIHFVTTTYNKTGQGIQFKYFASDKAATPAKRLITEWNANFKKSKVINFEKGKYNFWKANATKLNENFQKYITDLEENKGSFAERFNRLNNFLDAIGIYMNDEGLSAYVYSYNDPEFNDADSNLLLAANEIKYIFSNLASMNQADVVKYNQVKNVLSDQKLSGQVSRLAEYESKFRRDLAENTIMGAEGKQYWIYSMPSFITNRLIRLKEDFQSERADSAFYQNSLVLKKLRDRVNNPEANKEFFEDFNIITFSNLREENVADVGTDNQGIEMADQATDMLNKVLIGNLTNEKSAYYTLTPADKGRIHHITGLDFFQNVLNENGEVNDTITDIFIGYLLDELHRIQDEYSLIQDTERIKTNPSDYINHYHFKLKGNKPVFFEDGVPLGNAFKVHLFPGLSPFKKDVNEVIQTIFKDGKILQSDDAIVNNSELRKFINNELQLNIVKNKTDLQNIKIIRRDPSTKELTFPALDHRVMDQYKKLTLGNTEAAINRAVADFTLNSMIANIEYTKVFTGDYAFFKNLPDFSKRIPGTYTDGTQLVLREGDNPDFTLATLPNIEIPSHSLEEIKQFSPDLARAYSKVNATDAQGYITFDRWKFIMQRSNHWSTKFEEAVARIEAGNPTTEDYKYAAQPVKGVHYEVTDGKPVYIKYSAAVLVPSVIKGTALERLNNDMIAQGVDEAVVVDGIKVGAVIPSDVINIDGSYKTKNSKFSKPKYTYNLEQDAAFDVEEKNIKTGTIIEIKEEGYNGLFEVINPENDSIEFIPVESSIKLNTIILRNNNYKIQQDLRPKGIKLTLLGTQLKKTVLTNFKPDQEYSGIMGSDLIQQTMDVLSDLSNKGLKKLLERSGIDENGNVVDKEKLHAEIIQSLTERGANENLIEAISKEYDLDYVANYRQKIQNTIHSIINNATVKVKTNGGSFIQMSSWGMDSIEAKDSGVKLLVDNFDRLKAPYIYEDEDGNKKVRPGQVFVTSNYISKFIPNWKELTPKQLKDKIDSRLLKMVGYRIPNQGMSSNDSLEIVGILPESYGDTIVPYVDITTKTGSDFDIDKMYVMVPNGEMKKGKLTYVEYNQYKLPSEQSQEAVENRLMELLQVILEDEKTYDQLMSPLDSEVLKDDINGLHGDEESGDIGSIFFSPTYQLQKKFDNSGGKSGVGLTANQLVDHMWTQVKNVNFGTNLGFVNKNTGDNTDFSAEYDMLGEHRISDTLSWFLTAYVDIAKDPYISKGNHNQYTSNTVFMLLRAGTPIKFVNRLVGQPIIKELAAISSLRKSRIKAVDYRKMTEAAIEDMMERLEIKSIPNYNTADEVIGKFNEKGATKEGLLKYQERMEKDIKSDPMGMTLENRSKWFARQLEYADLWDKYHKVGEKFAKTVLSSKQDVNGAGKDFMSAFVNMNRREDSFNQGFNNVEAKFQDTFLGTAYENSVEIAIKVGEQLFVTANKSSQVVYNAVNKMINPRESALFNEDLGFELEKAYFANILGQTGFNLPVDTIRDMFKGENSLYDRVLEMKKLDELKDNYFLNQLSLDIRDGIKFIKMDSTKNNSPEALDEISRSWQELLENDNENIQQLGRDLIYYSYYNSGYRTNISSFFEHTPIETLKEIVEEGIEESKRAFAGGHFGILGFVDKFFRNNWNDDKIVPYTANKSKTIKVGNVQAKFLVVESGDNSGTENGKITKPYLKTSRDSMDMDGGNIVDLYKQVALEFNEKGKLVRSLYLPVPKLGYKNSGNNVVEYNSSIPIDGEGIIHTLSKPVKDNIERAKQILQSEFQNGNLVSPDTILDNEEVAFVINNMKNNRDQNNDFNRGMNDNLIDTEGC